MFENLQFAHGEPQALKAKKKERREAMGCSTEETEERIKERKEETEEQNEEAVERMVPVQIKELEREFARKKKDKRQAEWGEEKIFGFLPEGALHGDLAVIHLLPFPNDKFKANNG
jgi:DNA-binding transcriptional MerR regulator